MSLIAGTSHGINFEDMDVAALLKEDTDDDAFEQKVCSSELKLRKYPLQKDRGKLSSLL